MLSVLALACGHLAAPASATVVYPRVGSYYYGPLTVCQGDFAFDVREGEGYSDQGPVQTLSFPGGRLEIIRWSGFDANRPSPIRSAGQLRARGAVVERLAPPSAPSPPFNYRYRSADGSLYLISSPSFDHSDGDRGLLGRLTFADAARKMCATVPETLQPSPERETLDAETFDPRRHAGPLTVCIADLAFDAAAGEVILLPWEPGTHMRLFSGGTGATIGVAPPRSAQDAAAADVPSTVHVLEHGTGSTGSRAETGYERQVRARFRPRRAGDACFVPPPPVPASTSGL